MSNMLHTGAGATGIVHLYGIDVRAPWPIDGVPPADRDHWDVEFVEGDQATFAAASALVPADQSGLWAQYAELPDGSSYRRWAGLFEFLVTADARRVYARVFDDTHHEALLAYLLVDALSFSMVRLGREPLHATAISTARGTAAFLGQSGDGKSTLAALFLRHGGVLVTDDMLVLTGRKDRYYAEPGPPRIKLYREMAERILGDSSRAVPMNAVTEKLIIPLDAAQTTRDARPLDALYILEQVEGDPPVAGAVIRRLAPAQALPRLLAATAAHYPSDRDRLRSQFDFVTQLVQRVPVSTLHYRRNPEEMCDVRDAVLADLERLANTGPKRPSDAAAHTATALELVRAREIASVLDALDAAAIRPILLKGVPLAYTLYDAPSLRPYEDVDALVRREDVDAIKQAMSALGYVAARLSGGELLFCQFQMMKRDRFGVDHTFDFHWRISTQSLFAHVLDYDEVAAASEPLAALGPAARRASFIHALLLACIHPAMHHRNAIRTIWVHDIHLLASRLTDADLDRFVDLAVERRVAAICASQLALAAARFGTAVPDRIVARLESQRSSEPSTAYLQPGRRWHDELLANVRGYARTADRLRLLREVLLPPPRYILDSYALGPLAYVLLPLLYVHRLLLGGVRILIGRK
jgi:hypothetical protein